MPLGCGFLFVKLFFRFEIFWLCYTQLNQKCLSFAMFLCAGCGSQAETIDRREKRNLVDAPNMFDWFHKYWTCVAFGQSLSPGGHRKSEGGACLHLVHQVLQLFHPMCMTFEKVRILRGEHWSEHLLFSSLSRPTPKTTMIYNKSQSHTNWKLKDVESYERRWKLWKLSESSVSLLAMLAMSM